MTSMFRVASTGLLVAVLAGCAGVQYVSLPQIQQESILAAATKVMPETAGIDVIAIKKSRLDNPTVIIAGRLLEGDLTGDTEPYYRGGEGIHERVTRIASTRAYWLLKSVLIEADVTRVSELEVHVHQRMRMSTVYEVVGGEIPLATKDDTILIYCISINLENIAATEWVAMDRGTFIDSWDITKNLISKFDFRFKQIPDGQ